MRFKLKSKKYEIIVLLSLIIIIAFASFYPSLQNSFTNWDDETQVVENQSIRVLTWDNLKNPSNHLLLGHYIPLTAISYMLEYHFFNLNPFVYHLTNLVLHLLNCLFVFLFIYLISTKIFVAFSVSLLFGIHPLHVESVAWITERKDVLYTLFFLSSLISYLYYLKEKFNLKYYYFSLLLFLLSLLAKPMAVSLPMLLFLLDYLLIRRFSTGVITEKIPYFLLAIAFSVVAYSTQDTAITHRLIFLFPDNILYLCYRLIFYFIKTIYPVNLSCLYPYPEKINGALPLFYYVSPVVLAIIITGLCFLIKTLKNNKSVIFGILFFIISISPVLQIIPAGQAITADRYTYFPYIGLFFIIATRLQYLFTTSLCNRLPLKYTLAFCFAALIVLLGFLTWQRCHVWKDSITLWTDVLKKYPASTIAYNNRGNAYYLEADYDKAIADFSQFTKLSPANLDGYNNLCRSYWKKGNYELAFLSCQKAIDINPYHIEAYNNLGNVYFSAGRYQDAMYLYEKALQISPDSALTHNNICSIYQKIGKYKEALLSCQKAVNLNPTFFEAYNNLGNTYYYAGKYGIAMTFYKKVLELRPDYAPAHNNLAVLYYYNKQYDLAKKHYKKAVQLKYKVHPEFSGLIKSYSP